MYKVGFVGCAGTGKSTLAKATATLLDVEFLSSKDVTQPILERDGYVYGAGVQIERFLAHSDRQNEILKHTVKRYGACNQFVTDRTVIDLAAYAVKELHEHDTKTLRKIYDTCRELSATYTHVIICPWRDVPVEDNKRRTLNQWYQFLIHCTERGIIREWGLSDSIEVHVLQADGYDDRMKEITEILGLE
jgi:deoxyadenosine/deoxycytidine kinase